MLVCLVLGFDKNKDEFTAFSIENPLFGLGLALPPKDLTETYSS